jgi:hypothetical protein
LAARYGVHLTLGDAVGTVRHAITYRRLAVAVLEATLESAVAEGTGPACGWFGRSEIGTLPISSLVRKALGLPRAGEPRAAQGRRRAGSP